jgi:hexosaminidase
MRTFSLILFCSVAAAAPLPRVFPVPRQMQNQSGVFLFDESVKILVPEKPAENDTLLVRQLTAELSDWYSTPVRLQTSAQPAAKGRVVVMGDIGNPLVAQYVARLKLAVSAKEPGPEGYVLKVTPDLVLIAGSDARGAFYGLQTLRQLIHKSDGRVTAAATDIRDWPDKPLRFFRLYMPSREDMPFFKKLVRDVVALYKYNSLILETSGAVRFDRHPEVNAGWIEFAKDLNYSRRDRPWGPNQEFMDSGNHDVSGGRVLEKAEIAEMLRWVRQFHIEVIPEIPSLTHSYYLLARHRELAEMQDWEWPDAYCPSNPKSYELLFDVLDEQIDLIRPRMICIGHDEWRIAVDSCPRCRGKKPAEMFAEDVRKIRAHLAAHGVRTAIWADHLVESVRGVGTKEQKTSTGHRYLWPGALTPAQVRALIPKDILMLNWFWSLAPTSGEEVSASSQGLKNTQFLSSMGFEQALGNLEPQVDNWDEQIRTPRVIGGGPSSWTLTAESTIGKDMMLDIIGCAGLLWSRDRPAPAELRALVQQSMPRLRQYIAGAPPPSAEGDPVVTVPVAAGATIVAVNADASSLIFRHAAARPGRNDWSHRYVYNIDDTADLLGHYEVVYEDGFVATVAVRYGIHILEKDGPAASQPRAYCYLCDPEPGGTFSFEWRNPRFGKLIREVRLKQASGFRRPQNRPAPANDILWTGLSRVEKRSSPQPGAARRAPE